MEFCVLQATFDTRNVLVDNRFPSGGSNSAGRVRPCQGRCRGFESRLPLQIFIRTDMKKRLVLLCTAALSLAASLSAQDYKMEPIAGAPPNLPAAYASAIAANGYRIS